MRKVENDVSTYEASAEGFFVEIARINLEVNEYLQLHPSRYEQEANERIAA